MNQYPPDKRSDQILKLSLKGRQSPGLGEFLAEFRAKAGSLRVPELGYYSSF